MNRCLVVGRTEIFIIVTACRPALGLRQVSLLGAMDFSPRVGYIEDVYGIFICRSSCKVSIIIVRI
jgi:hypothetical protein